MLCKGRNDYVLVILKDYAKSERLMEYEFSN
jgi:hypothetical protein